jgi:hypothetical protein
MSNAVINVGEIERVAVAALLIHGTSPVNAAPVTRAIAHR